MSAIEIQRQIPALSNEELNQISAALLSERRKRLGIDLDELADQHDRDASRVDWDEVKEDVLNAP